MPGSSETTFGTGERGRDPGPPETPLTADEQAALLDIARAAVHAAVEGRSPPCEPSGLPERLLLPAGVFVSLHHGTELRGCIGTVLPDRPLAVATAEVAAAAATRDPRFVPVLPAELDDLDVEVSVLSAASPVTVEALDPARHGVCLKLGDHRAVLLPQVAAREGWDRETLLGHLAEKAKLPSDAWRDPDAILLAFTAVTVSGSLRATKQI
jgi:AmmeMemoRadiSam system protein A